MTLPLGNSRFGGSQAPQPHGRGAEWDQDRRQGWGQGRWPSALPKALLGAALVLAGAGSLISAGGAQAANNYSCAPRTVGGPGGFVNLAFSAIGVGDTVTCADKKWTVNSFDFGSITGDIDFEWVQVDPSPSYSDDLFSNDIHFSPSIVGLPGGSTGFFDYTIKITQPGWTFDTVQLDTTVAVNPGSLGDTKVIKDLRGGPSLTSVNGGQVGPISLVGGTSLTVRDTWTVAQGDVLTNVKDTFTQVPGPLPLLGAGAAFAWSRKLRSRVKLSALN